MMEEIPFIHRVEVYSLDQIMYQGTGNLYNCSITAYAHGDSHADGLRLAGNDGISFLTDTNTNERIRIAKNGNGHRNTHRRREIKCKWFYYAKGFFKRNCNKRIKNNIYS